MPAPVSRPFSRRTLIAGAATVATVAATSTVALRSLRNGDRTPAPAVATTPTPRLATPSQSTTTDPVASPTSPPQGGTLRKMAPASRSFDTFDAQQTGEPSVLEVLGRTHSRLVRWADLPLEAPPGRLELDLAAMLEQPDPSRLIFHIDPDARWQERAPLDGAPVTSEDVAASLERTLSLARAGGLPFIRRSWDWLTIERVEAVDPGTVVIETAQPDPFLLETLAGAFAQVQAPAAVDAFAGRWHDLDPSTVVGSGPFRYDGIVEGLLAFTAVRDGHLRPNLDALRIGEPAARVQPGMLQQFEELILRDRRDIDAFRALSSVSILSVFESSPIQSSFVVDAAPWRDRRLVRAIELALDRRTLVERLFGGRAQVSGAVAPCFMGGSEVRLEQAGLLPGSRDDAFAEARRLWLAAGGDALPELTVDVPATFDPLYGASGVLGELLREALDHPVRIGIEAYPAIAARAEARAYGDGTPAFWFGWGPQYTEPGAGRLMLETYRTGGPGSRSTGFSDATVDRLCDQLAGEFDPARRHEILTDIDAALLAAGGGVVTWAQQESEVIRRAGLTAAPPSPFPGQLRDAGAFFP